MTITTKQITHEIEMQPISNKTSRDVPLSFARTIIDCSEQSFKKPSPYKNPKASNPGPIMTVLQSEAGFTTTSDRKPILATYACNTCIGIAGYEEKNKMAFLIHTAFKEELMACGPQILSDISKFMRKRIEQPIQIHLRGGVRGRSDSTVRYIKNVWMKARADLPMELASEDILSEDRDSDKSLLIDSRTGWVRDYCPRQDPHARKVTKADYAAALRSPHDPKITIAYDPKL